MVHARGWRSWRRGGGTKRRRGWQRGRGGRGQRGALRWRRSKQRGDRWRRCYLRSARSVLWDARRRLRDHLRWWLRRRGVTRRRRRAECRWRCDHRRGSGLRGSPPRSVRGRRGGSGGSGRAVGKAGGDGGGKGGILVLGRPLGRGRGRGRRRRWRHRKGGWWRVHWLRSRRKGGWRRCHRRRAKRSHWRWGGIRSSNGRRSGVLVRLVRVVRLRRRVVRLRCVREAGCDRGGEPVVIVVRLRLRQLAAGCHGGSKRVVVGLRGPATPCRRRVRGWSSHRNAVGNGLRSHRNGDVETHRARRADSRWGHRRGRD